MFLFSPLASREFLFSNDLPPFTIMERDDDDGTRAAGVPAMVVVVVVTAMVVGY